MDENMMKILPLLTEEERKHIQWWAQGIAAWDTEVNLAKIALYKQGFIKQKAEVYFGNRGRHLVSFSTYQKLFGKK